MNQIKEEIKKSPENITDYYEDALDKCSEILKEKLAGL